MSIEVLATIGVFLFATFGGLVGIIYSNLKSNIKRNTDEIVSVQSDSVEWRREDQKFKLEVTESLTRLETLVINGGNN